MILPSIEDLRLFCGLVQSRSFVATAKQLGTSPAYVSKKIAHLEDLLQARLAHRTTRRVSITEDGIIVFQWAQKIIEHAECMAESISTAKEKPRGLLRICTSAGFGRKYVAPALSHFILQNPFLRTRLVLVDQPVVDLVASGYDLDIRIGGLSEPNMIVKRIAANYRILCASPTYLKRHGAPKTLADLAGHKCIIIRERDQSYGVWRLTGPNGQVTVKVTGLLECNNGEIALQWALDGHGIILRSLWDVHDKVKSRKLQRIFPAYSQPADICAVYPSRLSESAKIRHCVQFLEQQLKNKLPLSR